MSTAEITAPQVSYEPGIEMYFEGLAVSVDTALAGRILRDSGMDAATIADHTIQFKTTVDRTDRASVNQGKALPGGYDPVARVIRLNAPIIAREQNDTDLAARWGSMILCRQLGHVIRNHLGETTGVKHPRTTILSSLGTSAVAGASTAMLYKAEVGAALAATGAVLTGVGAYFNQRGADMDKAFAREFAIVWKEEAPEVAELIKLSLDIPKINH